MRIISANVAAGRLCCLPTHRRIWTSILSVDMSCSMNVCLSTTATRWEAGAWRRFYDTKVFSSWIIYNNITNMNNSIFICNKNNYIFCFIIFYIFISKDYWYIFLFTSLIGLYTFSFLFCFHYILMKCHQTYIIINQCHF